MLEQIVTFGLPSNGKSLKMTAVSVCANVTRPRLDLTSETILNKSEDLENDMYIEIRQNCSENGFRLLQMGQE